LLQPKLCILDETAFRLLDIDALQVVCRAFNSQRFKRFRSFIVVTHYQRLLDNILSLIFVHVLIYGKKLVKSGDATLAH